MGAELLRADGQTDMTKIMVAFRNFANAPKHLEFIVQGLYPDINLVSLIFVFC